MLHRLNYQAETRIVEAILKEWNEDAAIQAALETLNLKGWAALLEAENTNFSSTYQNRVDDKLETTGISFSDLRANSINAYKALCNTIYAYSIIKKDEQYKQLIDALNFIIDDYNTIIERRESVKQTEA